MTRLQDCLILTGMTLCGCDIANAAVAMLEVVPVYKVVAPGAVNGGGDATKDGGVVVLQKEMRLV